MDSIQFDGGEALGSFRFGSSTGLGSLGSFRLDANSSSLTGGLTLENSPAGTRRGSCSNRRLDVGLAGITLEEHEDEDEEEEDDDLGQQQAP